MGGKVIGRLQGQQSLARADCRDKARKISYQSNEFHASLIKFPFQLRKRSQLGRANGREVSRMAEQDGPFVADPAMKVDLSLRCLGCEVWRDTPQSDVWLLARWRSKASAERGVGLRNGDAGAGNAGRTAQGFEEMCSRAEAGCSHAGYAGAP